MIPYVSIEGKGPRSVPFSAYRSAHGGWMPCAGTAADGHYKNLERLFFACGIALKRIFVVSVKEMAGIGYEKGEEAADRGNS